MEGLTVGRMVHYVTQNGDHCPAIIVRVWDKDRGLINVQVIADNDEAPLVLVTSVLPDESGAVGTWHWIERA